MARWLLVLVLVAACKRESTEPLIRFDDAMQVGIGERTRAAVASPTLSAAFDAFLDHIVSHPRVLAGGLGLADQLMSDPALAGAIEAVMTRVGDSPQVAAALAQLVKEHPDATPEQIGELFGELFEKRWDTPEVSAAWMSAWEAFIAKLGTSSALHGLYREISSRVFAGFDQARATQHLNARLVQLNGGTRPDPAKGAQLYLDTAWSAPRIETLFGKLLANPTFRSATATLVADVLAVPDMIAALRTQCATLGADPAIIGAVVRAMQTLYAQELDLAEVKASLHDVMTQPGVVAAVREVIGALVKSDAVRGHAQKWLDAVRADKTLAAELDTFMNGW